MIKRVPDHDVNIPDDPPPLVLVPVPAEDVARRSRRIKLTATCAILVVLAAVGYTYKRYMDPMNAKESFDAGTRLLNIARYNQAILSFDRAVALKPDLVDAYLLRGESYVGNAQPELAVKDFTKVIELRPSSPTGWIKRSAAYLEINNFQGAISDASQAIAVSPYEADAYNLRGAAVRKSGDPKKALSDFNRAVELAPNADNFYQRGATYQQMGEHKLAIQDFTEVIEMIPDLGHAFFARAESRRAIGDIAGAQEDHRQGRILDSH